MSLGITQDDLAKRCNLSRATITDIESGDGDPRLSSLEAIANALSVPLPLLLSGSNYPRFTEAWERGRDIKHKDKIDEDLAEEIDRMLLSDSLKMKKKSLEMIRHELAKVGCADNRFIAMASIIALYEGTYFAFRSMLGLSKK